MLMGERDGVGAMCAQPPERQHKNAQGQQGGYAHAAPGECEAAEESRTESGTAQARRLGVVGPGQHDRRGGRPNRHKHYRTESEPQPGRTSAGDRRVGDGGTGTDSDGRAGAWRPCREDPILQDESGGGADLLIRSPELAAGRLFLGLFSALPEELDVLILWGGGVLPVRESSVISLLAGRASCGIISIWGVPEGLRY